MERMQLNEVLRPRQGTIGQLEAQQGNHLLRYRRLQDRLRNWAMNVSMAGGENGIGYDDPTVPQAPRSPPRPLTEGERRLRPINKYGEYLLVNQPSSPGGYGEPLPLQPPLSNDLPSNSPPPSLPSSQYSHNSNSRVSGRRFRAGQGGGLQIINNLTPPIRRIQAGDGDGSTRPRLSISPEGGRGGGGGGRQSLEGLPNSVTNHRAESVLSEIGPDSICDSLRADRHLRAERMPNFRPTLKRRLQRIQRRRVITQYYRLTVVAMCFGLLLTISRLVMLVILQEAASIPPTTTPEASPISSNGYFSEMFSFWNRESESKSLSSNGYFSEVFSFWNRALEFKPLGSDDYFSRRPEFGAR